MSSEPHDYQHDNSETCTLADEELDAMGEFVLGSDLLSGGGGANGAGVPNTLDPLSNGHGGEYVDDLVRVVCSLRIPPKPARENVQDIACTPHFQLSADERHIELTHSFSGEELDNDIVGRLVTELFEPGWLTGLDIFERMLTGIVCSTLEDPLSGWRAFYGNTLGKIRRSWEDSSDRAALRGSLIADMAPVYSRAVEHVPPGTVLDLGSCFGFLPLLLAAQGVNQVTASDIVPGTMRLLSSVASGMGLHLETLACDAAAVPLPDAAVRTVTAVHLLEHLDPWAGESIVAEALRVASERVVVAVPFERDPDICYGHVRRFDTDVLASVGGRTGRPFTVSEHHGGWLILDARR